MFSNEALARSAMSGSGAPVVIVAAFSGVSWTGLFAGTCETEAAVFVHFEIDGGVIANFITQKQAVLVAVDIANQQMRTMLGSLGVPFNGLCSDKQVGRDRIGGRHGSRLHRRRVGGEMVSIEKSMFWMLSAGGSSS